jgi:hypothetical protein
MNTELRGIYEADQADRRVEVPPADVMERDLARRRRVEELLAAGAAQDGPDCYHAAMVFQHGSRPEDYLRARELALRAAELGHRPGRWLAAAALDRWLMNEGRPQKYGTQYTGAGDRWVLHEVDPETTDAERAEWDVPPLAEARRRAEQMTAERPPQPGAFGLGALEAIARCRVGELEVRVVRMPPELNGQQPPPAPPATEIESGDALPWLPEGLRAGRVPGGFAALRPFGQWAVSWRRGGMPVVVAWREQDGPPPQPEPAEVDGAPAIWCAGVVQGWSLLVVARPDQPPWMVSGDLSRDELARVAASLP